MGKKVYNSKARRNPETIVDNSTLKDVSIVKTSKHRNEFNPYIRMQIKIEGEDVVDANGSIPTGYDEANALALPSKKRETKIKGKEHKVIKLLTKKEKKKLKNIVDKKKKKEGVSKVN